MREFTVGQRVKLSWRGSTKRVIAGTVAAGPPRLLDAEQGRPLLVVWDDAMYPGSEAESPHHLEEL